MFTSKGVGDLKAVYLLVLQSTEFEIQSFIDQVILRDHEKLYGMTFYTVFFLLSLVSIRSSEDREIVRLKLFLAYCREINHNWQQLLPK